MKTTKAISVLENMAVNLTGELGALSEDDSKVEMLTKYIEAINIAQEALKRQDIHQRFYEQVHKENEYWAKEYIKNYERGKV